MSKLKKISIITILIALLGYALSYDPNGQFLIPTAKLIEKKAESAEKPDSRIHSLDLQDMRRAQ